MPIAFRVDSIVEHGADSTRHDAACQVAFQASGADFRIRNSTGYAAGGSDGIAGRVRQFLLNHRPALFCDDCIAEKLGLSHRRRANRITVKFGTQATFWRDVGACSVCDKHKQVIRHV